VKKIRANRNFSTVTAFIRNPSLHFKDVTVKHLFDFVTIVKIVIKHS